MLSALLAAALSLVLYYGAVAFVAVFSVASALGAPASVDPPGFRVVMTAVTYGGPVWAMATAIATHRSMRRAVPRGTWHWVGDSLIVIGFGLMAAVFGVWPSMLAPERAASSTALAGAAIGFFIGTALAAVLVTAIRRRRNRDLIAEPAAT